MDTLRIFFLIPLFFFGLNSCAYIDVKAPGDVGAITQYNLTSKDFTVLDRVTTSGEVTLWFGAVLTGGKGYQDLLAQAQSLGGDAIMNYSFDFEQKSVLLFIYGKYTWKATGLAVKLADHVKKSNV